MEFINFDGTDLSEFLSNIPDESLYSLPFGLIRLDLKGTVLQYNMAEGEVMDIDPEWAIGKNFFDTVATCTKPDAFYGRFKEGVEKGFLNTVFDYTFNHRGVTTSVKVTMVTMPDHTGKKSVMVMIKRSNKPVIDDALALADVTMAAPLTSALPDALRADAASAGTPADKTA